MKLLICLLLLAGGSVFAGDKASFSKIYKMYDSDPSNTIADYRGKVITYSATATSISKDSTVGKYKIVLGDSQGRVIVSKETVPKELWDAMWKGRGNKGSKYKITFKGAWTSNRSKTFYFTNVEEISWTPPKKKKK